MKIKSNKRYLVIYDDNWADEMDISGFFTCDGEYLLSVKKKLMAYKDSKEFYIGSNESIEYDSGAALWDRLKIKEISDSDLEVLSRLFSQEIDEPKDKDYFEMYIYMLACQQDDPNDVDYMVKFEKRKKLEDKLKEENKANFAEIVKTEKIKQEISVEEQYILDALEEDDFEWNEESEVDEKIKSLTKDEREDLLNRGKKLSRLSEVSFGFYDVVDRFMESIEEDEEDEDDE